MRNPGGYARLFQPGSVKEWDTFTCGHCQRIVHVKPLQDPADTGGLCKVCMKLICRACTDKRVCEPWERKWDEMEARARARESYGV